MKRKLKKTKITALRMTKENMSSTATLYEFERYPYELSESDSFEDKTFRLTEKTLQHLENINEKERFFEITRKYIKPLGFVGVVKTGSITLEIFPKLYRDGHSKEHKKTVAGNLLKMLSVTNRLSIKESDFAALDLAELDLFEVFIRIFARKLSALIHSTKVREYKKQERELRFIRGRIEVRHYANPARLHIIPCRYHELSADTMIHKTLKYSCHLMARKSQNFETIRLLRSVVNSLDEVESEPVRVVDIDRIVFNRLNRMYEPFIRFCRIFLSHSTLTLQASEVESFSLMIPMDKLFEEFIAVVLQSDPRYFFHCSPEIEPQKYIGNLATKEHSGGVFRLIPDLVIRHNTSVFVIDTKYKILDEEDRKFGVSQADMYQMYAYVTKLRAKAGVLLYPDIDDREYGTFFFECVGPAGEERKIPLYIKSVILSSDLNTPEGWAVFRKSLSASLHAAFN